MPQARNYVVNFVARKLSAFPRFRALCHFDLELVGVNQVVCRHTKSRRSYLLDRAATPVTVGVFLVALFVLATFAGVRPSSDPVHCDRQGLVRFLADGAE